MADDIPSAIGGSGTYESNSNAIKPKGLTPFQQKKMLQKQNTTAITTGIAEIGTSQEVRSPEKNKHFASPQITQKRKSMSSVHLDSVPPLEKKYLSPKKRRSIANLADNNEKHVKSLSKSHTVMDVMSGDSKKKRT